MGEPRPRNRRPVRPRGPAVHRSPGTAPPAAEGGPAQRLDRLARRLDRLAEDHRALSGRVDGLQHRTEALWGHRSQDLEALAGGDGLEDEEDWDRALFSSAARRLGCALLFAPLIWNGSSLAVRCLEWWTGALGGGVHFLLTWLFAAAWGLFFLALGSRRR